MWLHFGNNQLYFFKFVLDNLVLNSNNTQYYVLKPKFNNIKLHNFKTKLYQHLITFVIHFSVFY